MRKKRIALLLCALLILLTPGVPVKATENIYFMGVEESILSISDKEMPFWYQNHLYIPSTIFSGSIRASIGVGYSPSGDGSWVALYRGNQALLFRKDHVYAEGADGRYYYPGMVERNGVAFVPASTVATYFGLQYSVKKVDHGWLVWLRSANFSLSEKQFVDAASSAMQQRYRDYIEAKNQSSAVLQPTVPSNPRPEAEMISGKKIYLCFRAGEYTSALLDLLDRYHALVTFFCTPQYLEENDDLLRRMIATGHSVGILVDAEAGESVTAQLQVGNAALCQATGRKTRLVRIENETGRESEAALAAGFVPSISGLKRSRYTLETSNQANQLFQNVAASKKASVLWMDEAVRTGGLVTFISQGIQKKELFLPLTETVQVP